MLGGVAGLELARSKSCSTLHLIRRLARRARTRASRPGCAAVTAVVATLVLLAVAAGSRGGVIPLRWRSHAYPDDDPEARARVGPVYGEVMRARRHWADVMTVPPPRTAAERQQAAAAAAAAAASAAKMAASSSAGGAEAGAAGEVDSVVAIQGKPMHWEDVMHDVLLIIKTGHEVADERLRWLRKIGWMSLGRPIPNLLVVSDRSGPGVVGMKAYAQDVLADHMSGKNATESVVPDKWFSQNGWRGDKDKNLPAFHLAHRVYPDKKWYVLLDDDTYIFLDNFARFIGRHISTEDVSRPLYTGKVFYASHCGPFGRDGFNKENKNLPRLTFAHGGSGIVLNAATLNALVSRVPECVTKYSSCWAGDIQVAFCLNDIGIHCKQYNEGRAYEKHFTPFSPGTSLQDERYAVRWRSNELPISFHQAPLNELALLSQFDEKCRREGTSVVYSKLLDHLTSHGLKFSFHK